MRRILAVSLGALTLLPAAATAAPVTVDLRVEGRTSTLYEGRVTTDIGTIVAGGATRPCDGTNNGANPTPRTVRGNAFATAAAGPGGFAFTADWFSSFQDISITSVAGESTTYDPVAMTYMAEFKNGAASFVGSCQDPVADGDRVVYATGTGSETVLALTGAQRVAPGATTTVTVRDDSTGQPVAGASVGGTTTGPDGTAAVTVPTPGELTLKASKAGFIRSNRLVVCASTGSDGLCGNLPPVPAAGTFVAPGNLTTARAAVRGIREGQRFARRRGPRSLRAAVSPVRVGILQVKFRLTRTDGPRCSYFSGRKERLVRSRCGAAKRFAWFGVGNREQTDYLLPARLPRGRYVFDVNVIDRAYNRDDTRRRGQNRIVFVVR